MSAFSTFMERMRTWPWTMKAALAIGVLAIIYLAWDTYVRPQAESWNVEAGRIERQVNQIYDASELASLLKSPGTEAVVTTLGPADLPPKVDSLQPLINETLTRHGASNPNLSVRSRGKLPKSALPGVTGGVDRIDRMTADVKFDARPDAAIAIIAELESKPEIQAISTVRMTKDAGGRIKVHLIVESWVISSERATGVTA